MLTYLYSFGSKPFDADQPNGPLLQASDGNFYGTSRGGGTHSCRPPDNIPCGVVFKMTPGGDETVLYSFGASATDAYGPDAPLIQGKDGALYGTTASGGTYGAGTAFRITFDGTYSVLYSFGASPSDGIVPVAALVEAGDGNFYGTTTSGGANHCRNIPQSGGNCGTIFKITPAGVETVLYSFGASPSDGVEPLGSLIQASDGNFYGTTIDGGANNCASGTNNCGTVFKITPAAAVTILHSFGTSGADGIAPQGPVTQGSDGALYGTTPSGGGGTCGSPYGCGTVFRITPAGVETILYAFAPTSQLDGAGPSPFILQARDGGFYGTARSGGAYQCSSCGTAFRLTPSGVLTTLYSFGPVNERPNDPGAGLTLGRDGAFYGVTFSGPIGSISGTVFKLAVQ
ncbi:MAG: choice-of-anchor tandem repeat GloVer-containing protein [Sphingomonas sp.]